MNPDELSHQQSLKTLNALYEYDDFMESIDTLVDLGCGAGLDLEWWATRTTRDNRRSPLNIQCVGIDINNELPIARQYRNITYQKTDFEKTIHTPGGKSYDILWCHDAFQYVLNPLQTLLNWRDITSDNGMLILVLPQTTNIKHRKLNITQSSGSFFHYTLVNLIHMLAVTGWDVRNGYFKKDLVDNWLHVAVYKSNKELLDLKTSWIDMIGKDILPESAEASIKAHSELRQEDLILPWLDKSLTWYGKQ